MQSYVFFFKVSSVTYTISAVVTKQTLPIYQKLTNKIKALPIKRINQSEHKFRL